MDHLEHCDLLEDEIARFAALVDTASLSAPVPTCPGWTVEDLIAHLGTVHRWAETLVSLRSPSRIASSDMGLDKGPVNAQWIRQGGTELLATLREGDPDTEMWAWGKDQHLRFWSRRELHETLVHRFDLELTTGATPSAPASTTADTIDEFFDNLAAAGYFSPNVANLRGKGERILIRARDTARAWTVSLHPDRFDIQAGESTAEASLSGPATTLSLVLYRRLALRGTELEIKGADELIEFWLANSALE